MVMRTPEEKIEDHKGLIERWIISINDTTSMVIRKNTYSDLASFADIIARNYCILENRKEAIHWLREATGYHLKTYELIKHLVENKEIQYGLSSPAGGLLYTVVASGDVERFDMVSRLIENLPPPTIPGTDKVSTEIFESYLNCMAPILRDEYDLVSERLPKLRQWEAKDWKECQFFEVSDSIEGIVKKDKGVFSKNINGILKVFKRRNIKRKSIQHCALATTMIILAKSRGLDISLEDIDEKYREFLPRVLVE